MKLIPAKSGGIIFRMLNMPEGKNEILDILGGFVEVQKNEIRMCVEL